MTSIVSEINISEMKIVNKVELIDCVRMHVCERGREAERKANNNDARCQNP